MQQTVTDAPADVKSAATYEPSLSYKEATRAISLLGIKKANFEPWQQFLLGVLAGLYIGVGSHLFLVALQAGAGRIIGGAVFSVGLVLVVVAGAELFTGNIIMVVAALTRRILLRKVLQNWAVVYFGNVVGALLFLGLVQASGLLARQGAPTEVGAVAAAVAQAKLSLSFGEAFCRGVLCNVLVILALIMSSLAKDILSKIACCVLPIMAFVASGFEHCVANLYLIPAGLLVQHAGAAEYAAVLRNLVPVTLGNVVGGIGILMFHPNRIRQLILLTKGREV
jgi:formate/nitrite transporter